MKGPALHALRMRSVRPPQTCKGRQAGSTRIVIVSARSMRHRALRIGLLAWDSAPTVSNAGRPTTNPSPHTAALAQLCDLAAWPEALRQTSGALQLCAGGAGATAAAAAAPRLAAAPCSWHCGRPAGSSSAAGPLPATSSARRLQPRAGGRAAGAAGGAATRSAHAWRPCSRPAAAAHDLPAAAASQPAQVQAADA